MTYPYDRTATVNRLEPLAESAARDYKQAVHLMNVAFNMVKLVAKEALQFLPKGKSRTVPGKGDEFAAVARHAEGIAAEFERSGILAEAKRLVEHLDELARETKASTANLKTASRVARRFQAAAIENRVKDVHNWMAAALSQIHKSEQYLKGVQNEVALIAHSDHSAKAHLDHLKKSLDTIAHVEKETRGIVDQLDRLARDFK